MAYTHPGGSKPASAKNQDTFFHVRVDEHNQLYGVLDGHGSEYGTLVAEVAARAMETILTEQFNRLRTDAEGLFHEAFELAHEAARTALLEAEESHVLEAGGVVVDQWEVRRPRGTEPGGAPMHPDGAPMHPDGAPMHPGGPI